MTAYKAFFESPLGPVEVTGTDEAVTSILFVEKMGADDASPVVRQCVDELKAYFRGELRIFTVPYELSGTAFQEQVWRSLETVPYGETATYRDIAVRIDNPKAVRAVGNANSKNQLTILLPCHRVIGTNGTLTGYAGGMHRKEWLLKHEQGIGVLDV